MTNQEMLKVLNFSLHFCLILSELL